MKTLVHTLVLLFCLLLCSLGSPAQAADWQSTFPAPSLGSYVEAGRTRWMVVAAGGGTDCRDAALALEDAFRQSGRTSLVMNDQSLGDVSTLDDSALVKKASAFPVDGVAVVRVFPGASGQAPSVVVTLYNKAGELLTALAAEAGKPIPAAQPSTGAGQGVTSVASEVVSQVIGAGMDPETAEKNRETFESSFVTVDELGFYNPYGTKLRSKVLLVQGKYKKPLTPEEFFTLAERPDLVAQAVAHRKHLASMKVGSLLAMVGGGLIMVGPLFILEQADGPPTGTIVLGGVIAVCGSFVWSIATKQDENPLTYSENVDVADTYNKGLKKRLGLTSSLKPAPGATAPVIRLGLGLGQGQGALMLHGAF